MKEHLKRIWFPFLLAILLLSVTIAFCLPYMISGKPFHFVGDIQTQWFPFYEEIRRLISNFIHYRELPFYSWVAFLGNNYWASKSYYGFFDIFNYFSFLFDLHFYDIHQILTCVKIIAAGMSFYAYSRTVHLKERTSVLLSFCYALSSWAIFFSAQSSFLSFYAIMPLFFLGIELFLQKKKKLIFIGATALCLFTNYYFFYTMSFFTPFYYLCRYFQIHGSFKQVVKTTLQCIGFYFVGVSITGLMSFPTIAYMFSNDRLGTLSASFFHDKAAIYFHHFVSMLVPSHTYIYNPNVFETSEHISREICSYAGVLPAMLIPQFLNDRDKKYRISICLIYVFFFLISTPIGSSVIHGFSEYSFRWMMLLLFFNLFVAGRYLDDVSSIRRKNLLITCTVEAVILAVSFWGGYFFNPQGFDFVYFIPQFVVFVLSFLFVAAYAVVLLKKKFTFILLVVLCFVECGGYAFYTIGVNKFQDASSWEFVESVSTVLGSPEDINYYLDSLSETNSQEFYRVYVPVESILWDYSHNWNLNYQLKSTMTYDSTYSPAFNDLRDIAWAETTHNDCGWQFEITDSNLLTLLSTKYSITASYDEIPFNNYQVIGDYYGLIVAENSDYLSFGRTYHSLISYEEYHNFEDTSVLLDALLIHEKDREMIEPLISDSEVSKMINIHYGGNTLSGEIEVSDDSFAMIALPYDRGWSILVNGIETDFYQVGGGMIGFKVPEGLNLIEMYFVPEGLKLGVCFTLAGILIYLVLFLIEVKSLKNLRHKNVHNSKEE